MTLKDRLALRIKTFRKRRSLTQDQLGELVGRSADAVSQLERGVSLPSFETLERLADALAVPLKDFFDFDEPEGSGRRTSLLATLLDLVRRLPDDDLEVVVRQVDAFAVRNTKLK